MAPSHNRGGEHKENKCLRVKSCPVMNCFMQCCFMQHVIIITVHNFIAPPECKLNHRAFLFFFSLACRSQQQCLAELCEGSAQCLLALTRQPTRAVCPPPVVPCVPQLAVPTAPPLLQNPNPCPPSILQHCPLPSEPVLRAAVAVAHPTTLRKTPPLHCVAWAPQTLDLAAPPHPTRPQQGHPRAAWAHL